MSKPRKRGVYLIHVEPGLKHARHYLGQSDDIQQRFALHCAGKSGVRMVEAMLEAGCRLFLVRTWAGGRKDERKLKGFRNNGRRGSLARICPACMAMQEVKEQRAQQEKEP